MFPVISTLKYVQQSVHSPALVLIPTVLTEWPRAAIQKRGQGLAEYCKDDHPATGDVSRCPWPHGRWRVGDHARLASGGRYRLSGGGGLPILCTVVRSITRQRKGGQHPAHCCQWDRFDRLFEGGPGQALLAKFECIGYQVSRVAVLRGHGVDAPLSKLIGYLEVATFPREDP